MVQDLVDGQSTLVGEWFYAVSHDERSFIQFRQVMHGGKSSNIKLVGVVVVVVVGCLGVGRGVTGLAEGGVQ